MFFKRGTPIQPRESKPVPQKQKSEKKGVCKLITKRSPDGKTISRGISPDCSPSQIRALTDSVRLNLPDENEPRNESEPESGE